jgi:CheY-like chemotaxis protein
MSRILLADNSPHAQRMGQMILREEGFEVVTVTDGETAVLRLADVDPDVILADVSLPRRSGYEVCSFVRDHPAFSHARVILTAGAMEPLDEQEMQRVGAAGSLRKPFEVSAMLETVKPLAEAARAARQQATQEPEVPEPAAEIPEPAADAAPEPTPQKAPAADPERVRAAVTLALDAALPLLIDELTQRVLTSLEDDSPRS